MDAQIQGALIGAGATLAAAIVPLVSERRKSSSAQRQVDALEARIRELGEMPAEVPADFAAEAAYIRGVRVFRREFRMKLWFREKSPDELEIEVEVSFTVVNSTGADFTFVHLAEVLPETTGDDTRILRASATGADLSRHYDRPYPTSGPATLKHLEPVTVRPNASSPGNRFEARYRKRARIDGSEVLFLVDATLGAEVVIEARPDDIDIAVEFSHREGDRAEVLPRSVAQPTRWLLGKAFLPWQSLYIQWHKKRPAP